MTQVRGTPPPYVFPTARENPTTLTLYEPDELFRPASGEIMGTTIHAQGSQATGCGCLGLMAGLIIGFCAGVSGSGSSSSTPSAEAPAYPSAVVERTIPEPREGVYIHGALNVRAAPRKDAEILRTLQRGDYVQMGPRDASGWAQVYSGGTPSGYAYRASEAVRLSAPVVSAPVVESAPDGEYSPRRARSRNLIRGPRGGCYYINSNGNRTYVDRSECD